VDGQYLICLLYRDFLLLASATKPEQLYTIQACIGLNELRVEEVDNGRGLLMIKSPVMKNLCRSNISRTAMPYGCILMEVGFRVRPSIVRDYHERMLAKGGARMAKSAIRAIFQIYSRCWRAGYV
jgi:hypothetical protein